MRTEAHDISYRIFKFACYHVKYRFCIHLLKIYNYLDISCLFDGPTIYDINFQYKIIKYISHQSSPHYLDALFIYEKDINNIFCDACFFNNYKLAKLLSSLKSNNKYFIQVDFGDIDYYDKKGYKDIVILLHDTWLRQIEYQKDAAQTIRDKYS